jgi:transposase
MQTVVESVPVFIGLDYHTKFVQICVVDAEGKVLRNCRRGNSVAELAGALSPEWEVRRAAMESCCGAADLAEELAAGVGWQVSLAHAGYVSRMKHNPDKSDYSDSRMLAELCRVGMIPPVWLPPAPIRDLRALVRRRADVVGRAKAVKCRILAEVRHQRIVEPEKAGGRWTKAWLAWLAGDGSGLSEQGRFVIETELQELAFLKQQLKAVEKRLRQATRDDDVVRRLMTIKGVGEVTAWTMRAMIGRFDRFATGKQLARFCAVTPRNASSGGRGGEAGLIKAGDPLLKSVLIEAAHRLKRHEPRWQALSERLIARGKPKSVVVAAIANRWVRKLFREMQEEATTA